MYVSATSTMPRRREISIWGNEGMSAIVYSCRLIFIVRIISVTFCVNWCISFPPYIRTLQIWIVKYTELVKNQDTVKLFMIRLFTFQVIRMNSSNPILQVQRTVSTSETCEMKYSAWMKIKQMIDELNFCRGTRHAVISMSNSCFIIDITDAVLLSICAWWTEA